jgi:hypothetical protein
MGVALFNNYCLHNGVTLFNVGVVWPSLLMGVVLFNNGCGVALLNNGRHPF